MAPKRKGKRPADEENAKGIAEKQIVDVMVQVTRSIVETCKLVS